MHPENAGPLYYTLFSFISLIAAVILLKVMRREGQQDIKTTVLPFMILGAIIGAKLPVFLSYGFREEYILTGKSYFGALVGALIASNIYKMVKKINGAFGDRFVVPLCVSAGLGKIGCSIYGCCGGTETDFFIRTKNYAGSYVHPAQIYESVFQFMCGIVFFYLYKTGKFKGLHFLVYLAAYSVFRFLIEFIRIEPRVLFGFTVYQVIAVLILPFLILMIKRRINEPAIIH
ncbi:MAG: hypothetical protein CVV21_05595 [Candidatus Goldiibacteriota bacterium HGW-Goldbacteria-1]|jgi:phosphatidylglycerol:prolipoprotein diacylglycerol transferase|nr:MAG: hypothetical protein CVV21_05595 [Candidatus Goldiibacteriota bacterium HGW-Goldbacteria-1]